MGTVAQSIFDAALPQITAIIVSLVGAVALALWGRAQIWAKRTLHVQLEALNRDALDAAIATGVGLIMDRTLKVDTKISMVEDYVRRSTPEAIEVLKAPADVLRQKIEAKIADAMVVSGKGMPGNKGV